MVKVKRERGQWVIVKDGEYKGTIYSWRDGKMWSISCIGRLSFNSFSEARDYAYDNV